jgi:hypothetical protein
MMPAYSKPAPMNAGSSQKTASISVYGKRQLRRSPLQRHEEPNAKAVTPANVPWHGQRPGWQPKYQGSQ